MSSIHFVTSFLLLLYLRGAQIKVVMKCDLILIFSFGILRDECLAHLFVCLIIVLQLGTDLFREEDIVELCGEHTELWPTL